MGRRHPTHRLLGHHPTASGASLWRAASQSASSDLSSSDVISSNLILSDVISSTLILSDGHCVIKPSDGRLLRKRPHHILASNINQQFRVQKYFRPRVRNVFANIFDLDI